jgi:hypothetical protein
MSFIVIWLHFFLQAENRCEACGRLGRVEAWLEKQKVLPAYSRADECVRSPNGRQDDEFFSGGLFD